MSELHPGRLSGTRQVGECLRADEVGVPDIDEAVSRSSGCQDLLVRVPLGEEDFSFVLMENSYALAI